MKKIKFSLSTLILVICLSIQCIGVYAVNLISLNVDFDVNIIPVKQNILQQDDRGWYVTMGKYNDEDVIWRLVGIKEEGATETIRFDSSTMLKPTSGTGTFILETSACSEITTVFNSVSSAINNYSETSIRDYLATTYVEMLYLADDTTYNAISPRTIADLHTDIGWAYSSDGITAPNVGGDNTYAPPTGTLPNATYDTIANDSTGSDKLWLMSAKEIFMLVGGGALGNGNTIPYAWDNLVQTNLIWNSTFYWLRSPFPSYSHYALAIASSGDWNRGTVGGNYYAVRPAFNYKF